VSPLNSIESNISITDASMSTERKNEAIGNVGEEEIGTGNGELTEIGRRAVSEVSKS
jgi:hypothetical protein